MNALWLDLRYATRVLRRAPGLTTIAILTLALGIGANTAIFTIVNAELLRPLPYPRAEEIVQIRAVDTETGGVGPLSPLDMRDLATSAATLEALGLYGYDAPALTEPDGVEPLRAVTVTSGFFDVLDMAPLLGRTLRADEDTPGAVPSAVLSHGFWTRRFGADPAIVGRTIRLDGTTHTVVGVMPEAFAFPDRRIDLWTPLQLDYAELSRGMSFLFGIARIRPGTPAVAAQDEATRIARRLAEAHPETNAHKGTRLVSLRDELTAEERPALLALMAAVTFVLLIACTNVANLLVVRASARSGEVAVRRALGAGRGRIARQFLIEGFLLAALGGLGGCILAAWGVDALLGMTGGSMTRVPVDGRVLGFTAAVLVAVALCMGLAQTLVFTRTDAASGLRGAGRGASGGAGRQRARSTLAAAQLALALPLLVGAALLMRTVGALREVPTGFQPDGVLTVRVELPDARYGGPGSSLAFTENVLERVGALPGVLHAGMTSDLPFSGSRMTSSFAIEGRPAPEAGRDPVADLRIATPGYFDAMGIGLLRGRLFDSADRAGGEPVALINETFARRFFPDGDAVGSRLLLRGQPTGIVGVIDDVRHDDLRAQAWPEFFLPMAQDPSRRLFMAIRVQGDPAAFADRVRDAVLAVDPLLPPTGISTMEDRLERWMAPQRVTFRLLTVFAAVALLLAAMGLYGVIAYAVRQRQRELGIRMALGANARDIVGLVIGQGARVIAIGVVVGIGAALVVARALASLLFGVGPADPLSFAAVSLLLAAIAIAACWLPARRAARTDPMHVLRYE